MKPARLFGILVLAVLAVQVGPAMAQMAEGVKAMSAPLTLARGTYTATSSESVYAEPAKRCEILKGWGWQSCDGIDAMVFFPVEGIDNVLIERPVSEGFIRFDEWDGEDRDDKIKEIWDGLVEGARQQSEHSGQKIAARDWLVYPTLDKQKTMMIYAYTLDWDGDTVINARASVFDRSGYVPFMIVPDSSTISGDELIVLARKALATYKPAEGRSYADFQEGDKVAAAGALGVLAAIAGVKLGKGAIAAVLAFLAAFGKKAIVLLVIAAGFVLKGVGNIFRRNKNTDV